MSRWRHWWTLTRRALFRRAQDDRDIDEEIRFHLAQETLLRVDRGEPETESRLAARRDFGSVGLAREKTRGVWVWTTLEQFVQDLRIGSRILWTAPALSATIIALLMLVVGGNATIFSIVHGLLTKPAAGVRGADRLVVLEFPAPNERRDPDRCCGSYPNYRDLASESKTIRPLVAMQFERFTFSGPDGSYSVLGGLVSDDYFEVSGTAPVKGRTLSEYGMGPGGSDLPVVISHRVWHDRLQQVDDVVGRRVMLNGHPATIIGVAPPKFHGPWFGNFTDLWVPITSYARIGQVDSLDDRSGRSVSIIGRLAPGASLAGAQVEIDGISRRLQAAYPDSDKRLTHVLPYSPIPAGIGIATEGPWVLAILSVVTLATVLIVCANVANLMLARAVARRREMAVRQSLGASRLRILRMQIAEGLVISSIAFAGACLFAIVTARVLGAVVPPSAGLDIDFAALFAPDLVVVAYAMALAMIGTVAFTIAPALGAWRQELLPWLKQGEHAVVAGRSRLASGLVILQLAFSVLLLTGAGFVYRSLSLIQQFDFGFDHRSIFQATVSTSGAASTPATNLLLLDAMRERIAAVPGVIAASYQEGFPGELKVEDPASGESVSVERLAVGHGYLRAFGLAPHAGRELGAEDGATGRAVTVSQNLADTFWPGQSALGRRLLVGEQRESVEIVGVTPDAFFTGFQRGAAPRFLFAMPGRNRGNTGQATFYVRHDGDVDRLAPAIGRALKEVDARVAIVRMQNTGSDDGTTWTTRTVTLLVTLFSVGSLLIATTGQYAVIAFNMRRRRRELGVRMALGASARQIAASVVRDGLRWTAAGLAIGGLLSLAAASALRSVLFGVTPTDPATWAGVFTLLAVASLVACYLPARRAARIDPVQALRQE